MKSRQNQFARAFSLVCALFLVFMLGMASGRYYWAPSKLLAAVELGWKQIHRTSEEPWYYFDHPKPDAPVITHKAGAAPGINLVTRVAADREIAAEIIDMDGKVLQRWNVDWFNVWPDATHLPERFQPHQKMESHIHGAVVMPNGDLVYNYDHLGLVRLDRDSNVVWRLPYQTHHSVHRAGDGNLWVSGQVVRTERNPVFPDRPPPYDEYTLLEVSPDGAILNEWMLVDLLLQNNFDGMYLLGSEQPHDHLKGDVQHLNDVEPFPSDLEPGFFTPGDIMVSLRNTNTVMVFNRDNGKIKMIDTGRWIYQHDPDFVDGNTISVYDNNHRTNKAKFFKYSRIANLTLPEKEQNVIYQGTPEHPFYSPIMGKHQWLPNGNLLVTESMGGRAFELTPAGDIVWEFYNVIGEGRLALLEEVQRLPPEYQSLYTNQPIN